MGGCVSLNLTPNGGDIGGAPSAHIISLNGELLIFPVPVTVSEVLQSQPKPETCFLSNSDRFNFDEYISSLKPEYQLQAGQIYFILPKSQLHYKLSASDMAALAVKASVALQKNLSASKSDTFSTRRNNSKARISPIMLEFQEHEEEYSENDYILRNNERKINGIGVSRSGSVRKLQRVSSRRAKLAVRSFRLKLSTIDEGYSLHSH